MITLRGGEGCSSSPMSAQASSGSSFKEDFEFLGSTLSIKQDTSSGHDAVIWDAARVLAKYFEVAPIDWRGRKVLDLGSGCGLTGICLATIGAKVLLHHIAALDVPTCLSLV